MLQCGLLRKLPGCCFVAVRLHDLPPSGFAGDGSCRHCRKPREARGAARRVYVGRSLAPDRHSNALLAEEVEWNVGIGCFVQIAGEQF